MNKKLRVFVASVANETNTFSPLRADLSDFRESFYAAPGEHPATPTLCSAVFPVCRRRAREEGWELTEGTATWAEPGGIVNQAAWECLRDQLLSELQAALPVDMVILGLHGAMVAGDCLDCEGDLLVRVRRMVGAEVVVGATLDPHSHLTPARVENADLLVAFKEFPHTDFVVCAETLVDLAVRTARGEITPKMSVFDCRMIEILPTSREPMRGFVDRLRTMEGTGTLLSVSPIHGFMAGDVPEMGTRILVITDNDQTGGDALAEKLGREVFGFRGTTRPEFLAPEVAIDRALAAERGPVVLADIWDNPGGGVAGDSTTLLRHLLDKGVCDAALATIWDPIAVRTCMAAGEGTRFPLRFGGKMASGAGAPIDAEVTVRRIVRDAVQNFGDSIVPLGDAVVVDLDGVEVILNTIRTQIYDPNAFSNMGIDPLRKAVLVVKSTNHFHAAFSKIAADILYVSVDGIYPNDPPTNGYRHVRKSIWPLVENPFA